MSAEECVWACDTCGSAVFIPVAQKLRGGVCTQQARGCRGRLYLLDADAAAAVRARIPAGIQEQAWPTLVAKGRRS